MTQQHKKNYYLIGSVLIISLLAWLLQSAILLNWDVSWLLHATRRLLAGGTFSHDFPDMNPPMIMYLYSPVVIFNKIFSSNIIVTFRAYIFLIAAISFYFCNLLSYHIFSPRDRILSTIFLITLAFVYLILPAYEFGQREHVMTLLTMPYFLLIATRLKGNKISLSFAIIIGVLAGLGFAIKPYFLAAFVFVELYYVIKCKYLFSFFRPETICIILISPLYALSIFLLQPDYLSIVVPLAARNYYVGFGYAWYHLFFTPIAYICYFVTFLAIFLNQINSYRQLCTILLIATYGFFLAYLVQRTYWYYHILPAYSLAVLLFAFLFSVFTLEQHAKKKTLVITSGIIISILMATQVSLIFYRSLLYKEKLSTLISFIQNHAENQPIYFFTTTTTYEFPMIDYTRAYPASRYAFLGWIPGLLKREQLSQDSHIIEDKNYYIDVVAEELTINKPKYVFIDEKKIKSNIENYDFDYLKYFSNNEKFNQAWKEYHYVTTLHEDRSYDFSVYERNISGPVERMINTL